MGDVMVNPSVDGGNAWVDILGSTCSRGSTPTSLPLPRRTADQATVHRCQQSLAPTDLPDQMKHHIRQDRFAHRGQDALIVAEGLLDGPEARPTLCQPEPMIVRESKAPPGQESGFGQSQATRAPAAYPASGPPETGQRGRKRYLRCRIGAVGHQEQMALGRAMTNSHRFPRRHSLASETALSLGSIGSVQEIQEDRQRQEVRVGGQDNDDMQPNSIGK